MPTFTFVFDYQPIASEISTQPSRYKRAKSHLLAAFDLDIVIWIIYIVIHLLFQLLVKKNKDDNIHKYWSKKSWMDKVDYRAKERERMQVVPFLMSLVLRDVVKTRIWHLPYIASRHVYNYANNKNSYLSHHILVSFPWILKEKNKD